MIGRTLAHYEIVDKLGQGGMGVVYKARDPRLDRFVAIKVLSADRVADAERKGRFVREAKSASALNHPNIVTVHDIGEHEGVDFIVMEYVDGAPLDERIGGKAMPIGDALKYAVQIADALAAAHEAGIVHRDLKPGNVMVTHKGLAKVLDFGLAKLTEPAVAADQATRTVAASGPHTGEGVILGTVSYMSPEQAQGQPVDARSDIFSFGALLYEMVTGQRAFRGESSISALAAIIHKDPEPLSAEVPRDLANLINRCLRKVPARRFQHMDDLKVALEDLKTESDSGMSAPAEVPPSPKRRTMAIAAIIAVAALPVALVWYFLRQSGVPDVPQYRLIQLTRDTGSTVQPAISPDGKLVAYSSDRAQRGNMDIWVQQVSGGGAIRLTTEPGFDGNPGFSPEGSRIVYESSIRGIFVISALGGQPQRIAAFGNAPSFSPDGTRIAFHGVGGNRVFQTYIAPVAGGGPQVVPVSPESIRVNQVLWAPDGRKLLLQGLPGELRYNDWYTVPVEGGVAVSLGAAEMAQKNRFRIAARQWTAGNRVVFAAGNLDSSNIWDVEISPDGRSLGRMRRLTSGTGEYTPSMANDGRIAFASGTNSMNLWRLSIQPNAGKATGAPERITHGEWQDYIPFVSHDSSSIVFASNRGGTNDVWIRDLKGGAEKPLVASAANEDRGMLSPDGKRLLFRRVEAGKAVLDLADLDGGARRTVCESCRSFYQWLPGRPEVLLFNNDGVPNRLESLDVAGGARQVLAADPKYDLHDGQVSPDGRWLVFKRVLPELTHPLLVAPLTGSKPVEPSRWIPVVEGKPSVWQGKPWWSPDGRLLYFFSGRDGYMCVWVQRVDPATMKLDGAPFALQHFHEGLSVPLNLAFPGYGMAADSLYVPLIERRSNVWIAEPVARR